MVVLLESLWELPRTGSFEMSNCQELSPRLGGIGALKKKNGILWFERVPRTTCAVTTLYAIPIISTHNSQPCE